MNKIVDFEGIVQYNGHMIRRDHYIEELRPFYDSDLIKIITGIRRSGKSVILEQVMRELKEEKKDVVYLNFEDDRTLRIMPNAKNLIDFIESYQKKNKIERLYLFFDEIQEVKDWAAACKTLRLGDNSLFITGSNSKLLSREYTKEFSGRYVSLQVRPFVYAELLRYGDQLGRDVSTMDYLIWGAFRSDLSSKVKTREINIYRS